jgi:hypothetical protein
MNSKNCKVKLLPLFLVLLTPVALAKGGGVGYWLEGTVTNVRTDGNGSCPTAWCEGREPIQLVFAGSLLMVQYPDGSKTPQTIEFQCLKGMSVKLAQRDTFFGISVAGRGGGYRYPYQLPQLLQLAATHGTKMKLQLQRPHIDFADWQCPAIAAEVIRATDGDLE